MSEESTEPLGQGVDEDVDGPRERIVAVATALFARKGYAATSIREITQASAVTNPMIYYYFGSKAGLFRAILEESVETIGSRVELALEASRSFRQVLVDMLTAYFETTTATPDRARLYLSTTLRRSDVPEGFDLEAVEASQRDRFAALIELGKSSGALAPDVETSTLRMTLGGLILVPILEFLHGFTDELGRAKAEQLVTVFLDGAGGPGALSDDKEALQ